MGAAARTVTAAIGAAPSAAGVTVEAEADSGLTLGTCTVCAPTAALAGDASFCICGGRLPGRRIGSTGSARGAE